MKVRRYKQFIKDFKKTNLAESQFDKLIYFVGLLREGKELPLESRDHALRGEWEDFREFHLGGDMLIIYRVEGDDVVLTRIGTHSQLFK